MRMEHAQIIKRKPVNLSLDEDLVRTAREHGINISRASEAGVRVAIREESARRWEEENRAAIEGWNRWTAQHGLPLAHHRQF